MTPDQAIDDAEQRAEAWLNEHSPYRNPKVAAEQEARRREWFRKHGHALLGIGLGNQTKN